MYSKIKKKMDNGSLLIHRIIVPKTQGFLAIVYYSLDCGKKLYVTGKNKKE
jgi:hypothetical protein